MLTSHLTRSMPQSEKDMLFELCLTELEIDSMGHQNNLVQRFIWHVHVYFQLDAFIYVLSELRNRTAGKLVERAWEQIGLAYEYRPELIEETKNSLFVAIGSLTLKAWARREDAMGIFQTPPRYISQLRTLRNIPVKREPAKAPPTPAPIESHISNTGLSNETTRQTIQAPTEVHMWDTDNTGATLGMTFDAMPGITPTDWEYWQSLMDGELPTFGGDPANPDWM